MKAQALRRSLTLLNVLLVLAGLAGAAFYVLKVRPAQADETKRAAWVKPAMDGYLVAARNAAPAVVYPVLEKDLEAITRPDLTDVKKGAPGVWPFVGPLPPAPKPKVDKPAGPPPPTGLQALGKLVMVLDDVPERTVMLFEFSASKRRRAFGAGDRIEDKDSKPAGSAARTVEPESARAPGLYLVTIERADEGADRRFRIEYDVVPEGGGVVERQTVVLSLKQDVAKGDGVIRTGTGGLGEEAGGPGTTTVAGARPAGGAPAAPSAPPTLDQVGIEVRAVTDQNREVVFDDAAWRYFRDSDPDKLIGDVKTEDAKDARGDPKGVRLTGVPPGSLASKFNVQAGDILKSINGKAVHSRAEAIDVVKGLPKDVASVAVVIERDGRDYLYNVDPRDPKTRSAAGRAKFDRR